MPIDTVKFLEAVAMGVALATLAACSTPPSCRGITAREKLKIAIEGPILGNLLAANAAERHKVNCVEMGSLAED